MNRILQILFWMPVLVNIIGNRIWCSSCLQNFGEILWKYGTLLYSCKSLSAAKWENILLRNVNILWDTDGLQHMMSYED